MLHIMLSLASFVISTFTSKRNSRVAFLDMLLGMLAIMVQTHQGVPHPSIGALHHIEILSNELTEEYGKKWDENLHWKNLCG